MVKNDGCQRYIISLFQTISSEERMQIVKRELAQMKDSNKATTSCGVQKEKCSIGRLRIQHNVRILSEHEIKKEDNKNKRLSKHMKKQGAC
jgi:hypothetical protein